MQMSCCCCFLMLLRSHLFTLPLLHWFNGFLTITEIIAPLRLHNAKLHCDVELLLMRKTSRSVSSQGNNSISLFVRDNNNSSIWSANLPFRDSFANVRNWINVIHCVFSGFKYMHWVNLTRCVRVSWITHTGCQWRIQDFPEEGASTLHGGRRHMILPNFPKNCLKLKEFGPGGASLAPPLHLPLDASYCIIPTGIHIQITNKR